MFATAAAAWAGVLIVLGLSLCGGDADAWPMPVRSALGLGVAAIAGGQFVFMTLVADRWCPHVSRPVRLGAEAAAFAGFATGWVVAGVAALGGAS